MGTKKNEHLKNIVAVKHLGRNSGKTAMYYKELFNLTPEDLILIRLLWDGKRTPEIALPMRTTVKGIEGIKTRLLSKLGFKNSLQLVRFGVEQGIIKIQSNNH